MIALTTSRGSRSKRPHGTGIRRLTGLVRPDSKGEAAERLTAAASPSTAAMSERPGREILLEAAKFQWVAAF